MKKYSFLLVVAMIFAACGDDDSKKNNKTTNNQTTTSTNKTTNNKTTNNKTTSATTSQTTTATCECKNDPPKCEGSVFVASSCDPSDDCKVEGTVQDCAAENLVCDDIKGCIDTCKAGDPCLAPAASCTGAVLTSYSGAGMCNVGEGKCDYTAVTKTTDCGADKKVCQTDKCVDLCENEMCVPPAGTCAGEVATSYSGNGICQFVDGMCDFAAVKTTTDCAAVGQTCVMGECTGGTPMAPMVGDLVITEFLANPSAVSDSDGEWFEVLNVSATPILLNGLELKDDGSQTHIIVGASDIVVNPGQYFVFGVNIDMTKNGGVKVDYLLPKKDTKAMPPASGFTLSNSSDEIIISNAGVEIDRVDWIKGRVSNGRSSQVDNKSDLKLIDNNDSQFWCNGIAEYGDGDKGTAGAVNRDCETVLVTIYDIQDTTQANHPADGVDVDVKNVVVSAKNGSYLWVQEVNGGPYSGIFMRPGSVPNATATLTVGTKFDFVGTYSESFDHSQIDLKSFTVTGMGNITPEILDSALFADPLVAEQWEGVLVQINEAGVTEKLTGGEFMIDGVIRVDDLLFSFTQPDPCSFYEKIIGPVNYYRGVYKIEPRSVADLVVSSEVVSDQSAAQTAMVEIKGIATGFSPKVLCIKANVAFSFKNTDAVPHNAVSRNPAASAPNNFTIPSTVMPANNPLLSMGQSAVVGFANAGTEHYRCRPHAGMEGVIIVVP